MANRNRNSQKGPEKEDRTGAGKNPPVQYRKLRDNLHNRSDESVSTRDNPANGKYSRTGRRDDEIKNSDTRGGR